jgi:Multicopper oxidase
MLQKEGTSPAGSAWMAIRRCGLRVQLPVLRPNCNTIEIPETPPLPTTANSPGHYCASKKANQSRSTLNSFELTRVAGQATSGVIKDVVMVGGFQEVEIDFVADNPGLTLFHCHQQLHMDFGFMSLFEYV